MPFDPLTAILDTVKTGFNKFLPDKMGEADKMALQNNMSQFILSEASKDNSEFRSFMLAYEGSAKDVGPAITFIRGIIRPFLTITVTGTYMWGWLHPEKFTPEQMALLKPMVLIVLLFWFGDKIIQHSGLIDLLKAKITSKK